MKKTILLLIIIIFIIPIGVYTVLNISNNNEKNNISNEIQNKNTNLAEQYNNIQNLTNNIQDQIDNLNKQIEIYNLSDDEIKKLPTTKIIEQKEDDEIRVCREQIVEEEKFEEQGPISYNGTTESPKVSLGNYVGLTYYSQIDDRWSSHPYTITGEASQTIGISGCGPTCASMIVTATKGTITPPEMGDLFVKYGYRSKSNGTYLSAFRFVADTFNIEYKEEYKLDEAINLLKNGYYVVVSCGNGLFTTGGHIMVLVGVDGDTLKIYDPYLYSGKFDTSTRRGKVTVSGNTVYCSISNFRNYANYTKFFAYKHDNNISENNYMPVTISSYSRYVDANGGLNVRNSPNGSKIGGIQDGSQVTVYETQGNWSRIGTNRWVSSDYLITTQNSNNSNNSKNQSIQSNNSNKYSVGNYKVTASLLHVRSGPGTNYKIKKYNELTSNAIKQNKILGNSKANGYKKGTICTVIKVNNNWGKTNSGWICLDYCKKI